jgi:hypothetical protein
MSDLTQTIVFFFALLFSIYFFGKLMTWMVERIKPNYLEDMITQSDITRYCLVMLISIILWSILFYDNLQTC